MISGGCSLAPFRAMDSLAPAEASCANAGWTLSAVNAVPHRSAAKLRDENFIGFSLNVLRNQPQRKHETGYLVQIFSPLAIGISNQIGARI
jgi:hypothetical protein